MIARGGRRNGVYAWVPPKLVRDCPTCGAVRGRKCGRMVGEQWVTNADTHLARKQKRGRAS